MGKSGFALEIASHVAVEQQTPCAFFTLEMSRQEVAQRLICSRGKVDAHHIRTGKLSKDDWPRLTEACSQGVRPRPVGLGFLGYPDLRAVAEDFCG